MTINPHKRPFTEQECAIFLLNSPRGRFIIGQALYLAIEKLSEIADQFQEKSNIADMKALQTIFFPYEIVVKTQVTYTSPLKFKSPDDMKENIGGGLNNG
jgi:hypothetical protein